MKRERVRGAYAASVLAVVIFKTGLPPPAAAEGAGVLPTLAARGSSPLGVSASLTFTFGGPVREDPQFCTHEVFGPSLQLEAGIGGGLAGVGVALVCRDDSWLARIGLAVRGVVVRTWGAPWRTEPERTYLGGTLDVTVARVTARGGVLKRVGTRSGPAPDTMVAFGIGVGF